MGLNRVKMQPCGFCFVEYATRQEASLAVNTLNRSVLDGRIIRVDWDYGFEPLRQFGRGRTGGQVRDDKRAEAAGKDSADTQMVDADRPFVKSNNQRRDNSHRGLRRDGGYHGHYNNMGDGDGGRGRYHSHHHHSGGNDSYRGGYNSRKRTYRDRSNMGDDNGGDSYNNNGYRGGGGHHYPRGSTSAGDQQQSGGYQDFDSE